ncbi:MAG: universal stress protein [Desulfobacteraceae bacterium]|nr:universal stress protein [Desulfobacteraceae bacterium]
MADIFSFEPRRILCPLDFSELSDLALKYAEVAAREYNATLHVLHAETFELPRYFSRSESDHLIQELATAKTGLRNHLAEHVQKVLGIHAKEIDLKFDVIEAHPVGAILDFTKQAAIDLIVIGTHGYGGLKRLRLGSVAENTVANVTVPVFTVRQKTHLFIDVSHADSIPVLERILCPSNMSETAVFALRHAAAIADRFGAVLTVLHIRETDKDADISKDEEKLCSWIADTVKVECEVKPMVSKGHAAEEILSYAKENKDDLIVLGARHQQFLEVTFFGRTTELVVRHAPCPVLITPRFPGS